MADINLNLEESALTVNIGGTELKFLTTQENLARLVRLSENAEAFQNELLGDIEEPYNELKNKFENATPSELQAEDFDRLIEFEKVTAQRIYGVFFGDGAFEKLYKNFPDVAQLNNIFPAVMEIVSEGVQKDAKKQQESVASTKQRILAQKYMKKRNKRRR